MGSEPAPARGAAEGSPRQGSRHAARKRALDILYEADLKDRPVPAVLAVHLDPDAPEALADFTVEVVRGVHRHREEVDGLIQANARDWKLSRMPVVDRNLLRIALFEILHSPEVSAAVAIDEAVELAKELSTDDSGRFVNGVLGRIVEQQREAAEADV